MHAKLNFEYINHLLGGPTHIWGATKLDSNSKFINVRDLAHYKAKEYTLLVHRKGVESPQFLVITHEKLWTTAGK